MEEGGRVQEIDGCKGGRVGEEGGGWLRGRRGNQLFTFNQLEIGQRVGCSDRNL